MVTAFNSIAMLTTIFAGESDIVALSFAAASGMTGPARRFIAEIYLGADIRLPLVTRTEWHARYCVCRWLGTLVKSIGMSGTVCVGEATFWAPGIDLVWPMETFWPVAFQRQASIWRWSTGA